MYRVLMCTVLFFLFRTADAEEPTSTKSNPPRLSAAESLGMRAGRVLGAAKICQIDPERLQSSKHSLQWTKSVKVNPIAHQLIVICETRLIWEQMT